MHLVAGSGRGGVVCGRGSCTHGRPGQDSGDSNRPGFAASSRVFARMHASLVSSLEIYRFTAFQKKGSGLTQELHLLRKPSAGAALGSMKAAWLKEQPTDGVMCDA